MNTIFKAKKSCMLSNSVNLKKTIEIFDINNFINIIIIQDYRYKIQYIKI